MSPASIAKVIGIGGMVLRSSLPNMHRLVHNLSLPVVLWWKEAIVVHQFCASHSPTSTEIAPGQPFTLDLLDSLAQISLDKDQEIVPALRRKVPTGVFEPIPRSQVWPAAQPDDPADPDLLCNPNDIFHRVTVEPPLRDLAFRASFELGRG